MAVLILLAQGTGSEPGTSRSDDPIVVRTVPGVVTTPWPQRVRQVPARAATLDAGAVGEHDRILHVLRLPPSAQLRDVVMIDPGQRVVCGTAIAAPAEPARRFVYIGAAGLGAIDDGGKEFDRMTMRICGR